MNKKTKALTTEQYKEIIQTMREGFSGCRPNERIATALVLEGNLGLRISDILKLRPCDIVRDGDRYRLEITEQKTGKRRVFTVPLVIQQYIENYCLRHNIRREDLIFPITERAIQKQLHIVCDYLGFEGISTHSFRKWYATEIYKANGYDIPRRSGFWWSVTTRLRFSSPPICRAGSWLPPCRLSCRWVWHRTALRWRHPLPAICCLPVPFQRESRWPRRCPPGIARRSAQSVRGFTAAPPFF